jgi:hypothetical protein
MVVGNRDGHSVGISVGQGVGKAVGAAHFLIQPSHILLLQSWSVRQARPCLHLLRHFPPQSTSVSSPSLRPSLHMTAAFCASARTADSRSARRTSFSAFCASDNVGRRVGIAVGSAVGRAVGEAVGEGVAEEGAAEGADVGGAGLSHE